MNTSVHMCVRKCVWGPVVGIMASADRQHAVGLLCPCIPCAWFTGAPCLSGIYLATGCWRSRCWSSQWHGKCFIRRASSQAQVTLLFGEFLSFPIHLSFVDLIRGHSKLTSEDKEGFPP